MRDISLENNKIYILNAAGKYDIHRYMNLFGKLGIKHSVLYDGDNNKGKHKRINNFIQENKNGFTLGLHCFEGEFEDFLEIKKEADRYKKPLNVMWHYKNNKIKQQKIDELAKIIKHLIIEEK
jgi:predicted ATP-dependent endonuclease of OLD family